MARYQILMNPIPFFKFLEREEDRRIPLQAKISYELPIDAEDLKIDIMHLSDTLNPRVKPLPEGLQVEKELWLGGSWVGQLPNHLTAPVIVLRASLSFMRSHFTSIDKVPRDIEAFAVIFEESPFSKTQLERHWPKVTHVFTDFYEWMRSDEYYKFIFRRDTGRDWTPEDDYVL